MTSIKGRASTDEAALELIHAEADRLGLTVGTVVVQPVETGVEYSALLVEPKALGGWGSDRDGA